MTAAIDTTTIGSTLERLLQELHPGHAFAVEVWEVAPQDDAEDRATSPEPVA